MNTEVDFAGVFRAALPKAYISSVELLPSNMVGSKNGVSYDEESNDTLELNQYGKRRPKRGRQRFDEATGLAKGLQIRAEITIRDFIRPNQKTVWFDNPTFKKYLKLNVVLAKGAQTIERLQDGNFRPRVINRLKSRNRVIQKTISTRKEGSIMSQREGMIDGRKVYCVTYEVIFNLPNYNPRDISIFASTFINMDEYNLENNIQVTEGRRLLQGIVDTQNIIRAGSVPARSKIALLPDNKVWAGPVHFHEGTGLMAGAFHSQVPHPVLTEKLVPNLVVKDYRSIESLKEAELLLKPYQKRRRKKLQNRTAQGNRIIKKNVYITEPDYSFDQENQVRFLFHVDFFKIISEKTQFGSCFVNADKRARREIIRNTKLSDITITRNRVRRGLRKSENVLVDYEDRNETVAQSASRRGGRIRPSRLKRSINPELQDTEEVTIGGIREIQLGFDEAAGIRTFTVSDFDMARKTDGNYCYSVTMSVEDGTVTFVQDEKRKLLDAIGALKEYAQTANQYGNYDAETGKLSSKFTKLMEELYPTPEAQEVNNSNRRQRRQMVQDGIASAPWLNAIATYADVAGSLTSADEQDLVPAVLLMESLVSPTSGTVQGLETVIETMEDLESKISSVIDSRSGKGSAALGTNVRDPMMDEVDFNAKTGAFKGKAPKTSIIVAKKFKKIHDSNIQNSVGYDFLGGRRRNNIGLRTMTTDQMSNRLSLENQKYFNQDPFAVDEQPKVDDTEAIAAKDFTRFINLQDAYYSYLTPARLLYGNETLNMLKKGRRLWNTKQYSTIVSSLMATTTVRDNLKGLNPEIAPEPNEPEFVSVDPPVSFAATFKTANTKIDADDLKINVANSIFASKMGVSVVSPMEHRLSVKQERALLGSENNEEDDELFGIDPKKVLGENTKFATDRLEELELATDETIDNEKEQQKDFSSVSNVLVSSALFSEKDNFRTKKVKGVLQYNPTNERNIIDNRLRKFDRAENAETKKQNFVSNIPNQIKSVMLGSDRRVNKNWFEILEQKGIDLTKSSTHVGLNYINYCHINQIQILVGFETDRFGNPEITSPIYRRLTKERFDAVVSSGRPSICRMRPYSFEDFKKSKKLRLPEFDQHFLLTSRNTQQDLRADSPDLEVANDEDLNEQVSDDLLIAEDSESREFVSRLTEFSELNTTGRKMLRLLVRRNTLLGDLMPEFTNTAYMQQPRTISRIGTTFASRQEVDRDARVSQATTVAAQQGTDESPRQRRQRRAAQRRTPQQARPITPASGPMGGMTSGGGSTGGGGGY